MADELCNVLNTLRFRKARSMIPVKPSLVPLDSDWNRQGREGRKVFAPADFVDEYPDPVLWGLSDCDFMPWREALPQGGRQSGDRGRIENNRCLVR
jgi:hypothetical protein